MIDPWPKHHTEQERDQRTDDTTKLTTAKETAKENENDKKMGETTLQRQVHVAHVCDSIAWSSNTSSVA